MQPGDTYEEISDSAGTRHGTDQDFPGQVNDGVDREGEIRSGKDATHKHQVFLDEGTSFNRDSRSDASRNRAYVC